VSAPEKPIECMSCGATFAWEELEGVKACPACGSRSVPVDRRQDQTITINPHELRILTLLADNYVQATLKPRPDCADAVRGFRRLLARLRAQVPGTPLTMGDEVNDVAASFNTKVQLIDGTGAVIHEADGTLPKA
jgi:DNA-directed RNA polymerase subunit RPC12/RpoP